jgi:hypothetical protein
MVNNDQIAQIIFETTGLLRLDEFCQLIKETKRESHYRFSRNPFSNAGYKPIYFLLREEKRNEDF